jgi:hypothetical protein
LYLLRNLCLETKGIIKERKEIGELIDLRPQISVKRLLNCVLAIFVWPGEVRVCA